MCCRLWCQISGGGGKSRGNVKILWGLNKTDEVHYNYYSYCSRSQWPRGLRRWSAAARLLGLLVRIPPGAWMSVVSVAYWQVEFSATSWSLVQRSPTECGVCECDREASTMRRPWPTGGCQAIGKKNYCKCTVMCDYVDPEGEGAVKDVDPAAILWIRNWNLLFHFRLYNKWITHGYRRTRKSCLLHATNFINRTAATLHY
jgi:hypothetical protein